MSKPSFEKIRKHIEEYKYKKNLEIFIEKLKQLPKAKPRKWFPIEEQTKIIKRLEKESKPKRVLILPYKKREWVFVYGDKKTRGPNRFLSDPNNIYVSDIAIELDCDPKLVVEALDKWNRKYGKTRIPKPKTVFLKFIKGSKSFDYVGDFDEIDVFELSEFFGVEPKQILGKVLIWRESNLDGRGVIEL